MLVHGCNSPPGQLASLAGVFEAHGQQTVCFSYDDRERLEASAERFVAALELLKAHLTSRRIVVLGHSQGGLIARRALVRDRAQGLREDDGFRYELVTVSSPFHGIDSSADCGSVALRVITLGITVGVCRMVAGAMWSEIYPRSSFMRRPGTLLSSVQRHVNVVTDERATCRRRDLAGNCLKSDFVFSLAEQYAPLVDDDTRAQSTEIRAGHVEIVGQGGNPPQKLIRLLQEERILAAQTMTR
ncbi:MAG: hydrolase [Pseudomonadota bacterium]